MTAFDVPRYAIITTHNRPNELQRLLAALEDQRDYTVIIDNASNPPVPRDIWPYTEVIHDAEQPPNLYRLWNVGLATVEAHARLAGKFGRWDVAIFNDDADVPAGWYDTVAFALRSGGGPYAAASTGSHTSVTRVRVMTQIGGKLTERMCPWAFVTRGELGIFADEDFRWWFGDTSFEWTCRLNGGVIMVPGPMVTNTLANSTTVGELAQQAGRDGETFAQKWGFRPW